MPTTHALRTHPNAQIAEFYTEYTLEIPSCVSKKKTYQCLITFHQITTEFVSDPDHLEIFSEQLSNELNSKQLIVIDHNRGKIFTLFSAQPNSHEWIEELLSEDHDYSVEVRDPESTCLKTLFNQILSAVPPEGKEIALCSLL